MKNYLYSMFEETGSLNTEQIILNILVAVILGGVIYPVLLFHPCRRSVFQKIQCVPHNPYGLNRHCHDGYRQQHCPVPRYVGALSIVRFRTAIKDSRDTTYIFWTIIVGSAAVWAIMWWPVWAAVWCSWSCWFWEE